MNVIDRSIEFVASWEPDIAAGLRGASAAGITAIEARMGRSCSPVYRAFLERMGESSGSFDFGQLSTSVDLLLDQRGTALEYLPPGIELLAMSNGDEEEDVYLVHDPAAPDDAKLVRHASLEYEDTGAFDLAKAEPLAGGFGELLCLPALNRHHVLVQAHRIALVQTQLEVDALIRCRSIAQAFHIEAYWFANEWTFVGHAEDLVVIAKQTPGAFLSVGVAGAERFAWATVAGTLRWRLGLDAYR